MPENPLQDPLYRWLRKAAATRLTQNSKIRKTEEKAQELEAKLKEQARVSEYTNQQQAQKRQRAETRIKDLNQQLTYSEQSRIIQAVIAHKAAQETQQARQDYQQAQERVDELKRLVGYQKLRLRKERNSAEQIIIKILSSTHIAKYPCAVITANGDVISCTSELEKRLESVPDSFANYLSSLEPGVYEARINGKPYSCEIIPLPKEKYMLVLVTYPQQSPLSKFQRATGISNRRRKEIDRAVKNAIEEVDKAIKRHQT